MIIILTKFNNIFKLDSIFNKLVISFILITVFLSIILTCFFYLRFKGTLLAMAKNDLKLMSRQTSSEIFWEINRALDGKDVSKLSTIEVLLMTQEEIAREIWNARWQGIESISFEGNVYLLDKEGQMIYNNYDLDSDSRLNEDKNIEFANFFKEDYSEADFFQKIKKDKSDHKGTGGNGLARISASGYVNYTRKGKEYIGAYSKLSSLDWILIVDGQKEDILAPAKKIRRKMYYISGLALLVVTIIAVAISKYMTKPINQTVEFAKEIANGNLAAEPLIVNSNDEVGNLVQHLNNMRSNLEKSVNNIKNLLNNAGQGFLSFGKDLRVDKEYSVECENIFASEIKDKSFPELIFKRPQQQNHIKNNLKKIFRLIAANQEEEIHKYIGLLPEELKINDKYIKLNYKLVTSNNRNKIMVVLTDITEKKQIEKRALRDGLTKLYNHSYFQKMLTQEIEKMREYDYRHHLSLLMLDIDDFKQFNDTYGHQAGDEVLRSVARVLKQEFVSEAEVVARYGGEEFAIILPEVTKLGVKIKAKEVNKLIRDLVVNYNDLELQVTVSIGSATYRTNENKEEFIKRTDDALYQAKSNGKDTFYFCQ